jgi:hypothetical protein
MPKKTSTTKSSKEYYDESPETKKKKDLYNKEFNKKPEQRKKRSELSVLNKKMIREGKASKGDNKDLAHTKSGIVLKNKSANRGSKSDSPGDKRARG